MIVETPVEPAEQAEPAAAEPAAPAEQAEPVAPAEPLTETAAQEEPFRATLSTASGERSSGERSIEVVTEKKNPPKAKRAARPKAKPKAAPPPPAPASASSFASSFAPTPLSGLSTVELAAELMARRSVERRETKAQLYRSWVL